jgi:perosamine synthetase
MNGRHLAMKDRILYTKPNVGELEHRWVESMLWHAWGTYSGSSIKGFEEQFAKYIGTQYAVATSSCTGALHLGLAALGIKKGHEVILADTNWIATAAPIVYLGAKPVFVDIKEDTWCINPAEVKKAITKKTKAIIATHLYGNLCSLASLKEIAGEIPIIEDAAEAIGSMYRGKYAGSIGRFGVFSFHGSKTITSGEGGMFVTNSKDLSDKVRQLNNHGRSVNAKQFSPEILGYKYKMTDMQAALGTAQLQRVKELVQSKRFIFENYEYLLKDVPNIKMNPRQQGCVNGFWMPNVVVNKKHRFNLPARELFLEEFAKDNIDARVFFYPLSSLPMFKKANNPVAYDICTRSINLPSYYDMTLMDQRRVAIVIKKVMGR